MQHYSSLNSFCELRNVVLPKGRQRLPWRLTQYAPAGYIHALSTKFRGKAVATNGILVALENEIGKVTIGHTDYFVPLEQYEDTPEAQEARAEARKISTNAASREAKRRLLANEVDCLYE